MDQNAIKTIFHTKNIRHHEWKIVRTSLQCIIVLAGRSSEKLGKLEERIPFKTAMVNQKKTIGSLEITILKYNGKSIFYFFFILDQNSLEIFLVLY